MSNTTTGEIKADSLYTLPEIQARLGVRRAAWRQMRRDGLAVRYVGRRGYVRGQDVIDFVASRPVDRSPTCRPGE